MESDEFDMKTHREELVKDILERFTEYYRDPTNDAQDALTQSIMEVCDDWMYHADADKAMAVLDSSPNEPDDWKPHVRDQGNWRSVVRAMAYTVAKQDAYDALENRGYVDAHWSATEKLADTVETVDI